MRPNESAWSFVRAGSSSQPQAAHFLRCGRVVVRDHGLSHAQQVEVGPFASGAASRVVSATATASGSISCLSAPVFDAQFKCTKKKIPGRPPGASTSRPASTGNICIFELLSTSSACTWWGGSASRCSKRNRPQRREPGAHLAARASRAALLWPLGWMSVGGWYWEGVQELEKGFR